MSKIDKSRNSKISILFKYTEIISRRNKMAFSQEGKAYKQSAEGNLKPELITWSEKSA